MLGLPVWLRSGWYGNHTSGGAGLGQSSFQARVKELGLAPRPEWWTGPGAPFSAGCSGCHGPLSAASSLAGGPDWWIWLGWPPATLLAAVLLGGLEPRSARRRREQLLSDTPQALELMAAGLAAGMPVRLAGRIVADAFDSALGDDLGRVLALVELGVLTPRPGEPCTIIRSSAPLPRTCLAPSSPAP